MKRVCRVLQLLGRLRTVSIRGRKARTPETGASSSEVEDSPWCSCRRGRGGGKEERRERGRKDAEEARVQATNVWGSVQNMKGRRCNIATSSEMLFLERARVSEEERKYQSTVECSKTGRRRRTIRCSGLTPSSSGRTRRARAGGRTSCAARGARPSHP